MSRLATQLWRWCLEKNLSLSAEYLPGVDNHTADQESKRIQLSAEWKLKEKVFQQIMESMGECSVDLFASRLNAHAQLKQYVSWRPDPHAMATDALQILCRVCLPTFLSDRQIPEEGQGRQGVASAGSPNMEVPTMVPSPAGTSSGIPPNPSGRPRVADGPCQRPTSTTWKLSSISSRNFWRDFPTPGRRME